MRVLGVDGGLAHLGAALMDLEYGGLPRYQRGTVIETVPSARKHGIRKSDDNMRRAREIAAALRRLVRDGGPVGALVYEAQSFGMKGVIAARQAGTAFGILAALAEEHALPMLCVTPLEIKRAVANGAGSTKQDVIRAVCDLHPNIDWPKRKTLHEHLADAVGAVHACLGDDVILVGLRAEKR
jgi:Holliday junction resolvasome RuvABC endonuclease subunit